MNWIVWVIIGAAAISSIATVAMIGKPRRPITPTDAAWHIVGQIVWVAVVLVWWPR